MGRGLQEDQMHRYLFGRGRKRKTTVAMDRLIVHKIKSNRRSSADKVKVEIESELQTSLNVNTIGNRAHEAGLFGRVALKKSLVNNTLKKINTLSNPSKKVRADLK